MVDHKRMDALTELVERSGAKLIAVGDGKQLPSIGPGGMFDRIAHRAPTAELADVRRTSDPEERRAWAALRAGEPERAMAHYQARGQLYFTDTREEAGEAAVQTLGRTDRDTRHPRGRADRRRLECGDRPAQRPRPAPARRTRRTRSAEVQLPHQHYGLREGDRDRVHHPAPRARAAAGRERRPRPGHRHPRRPRRDRRARRLRAPGHLAGEDLESLRLGYAQHVYRSRAPP